MSEEQQYSNRELDKSFKGLADQIGTNHTETIGKIGEVTQEMVSLNTKVGIQNGRVTKNETAIANLQSEWNGKWKGFLIGAGITLFLIGVIITLTIYSFQLSQENLKNTILLEIQNK